MFGVLSVAAVCVYMRFLGKTPNVLLSRPCCILTGRIQNEVYILYESVCSLCPLKVLPSPIPVEGRTQVACSVIRHAEDTTVSWLLPPQLPE